MRCVVYGWHVILIYIILYTCVVLRMVLNNQSSERLACSSLLNHKPFSVQMYLWSEHFAKGRHPFFHIFSFCSVFWREGFLSFFITNFCKWFQRKIILWFGSARKERSTHSHNGNATACDSWRVPKVFGATFIPWNTETHLQITWKCSSIYKWIYKHHIIITCYHHSNFSIPEIYLGSPQLRCLRLDE